MGFILLFVMALAHPVQVWAHGGEQHGTPAATVGGLGPVTLSDEARMNLGIGVEDVQVRDVETVVPCFGVVESLPDRVQWVSPQIDGRVTQALVKSGDRVEAGDLLAVVQSRQVGNPPPSIELRSLIAGTVTERQVDVGEPVEPEDVLFRVVDLSEVLVRGNVYEADVAVVRLGQKVRVFSEAFSDRTFEGTVERLGGQLDSRTRTLAVYVKVMNPDRTLRPGMRVRAELVAGVSAGAIAVPQTALLGGAGNYFVFLDQGDHFSGQPVGLGRKDEGFVEILEGLFPGDRVVTHGAYELQFAAAAGSAPAPTGNVTTSSEDDRLPATAGKKGAAQPAAPTAPGVRLSGLAQKNLHIAIQEAQPRAIDDVIKCYGVVETDPIAVRQISVPIEGQVIEVFAREGEHVSAGQVIARIQSRQVGDPPAIIEAHSTIDGVVLDRHVFLGESVEANKTLFTIASPNEILVRCHVYEAQVEALTVGLQARVYSEAYPDEAMDGTLEFMGGRIDEDTRTLPVWVRVSNAEGKLLPNMRVEADFIVGQVAEGIAVPVKAILSARMNPFVFLVNGEHFERQPVTLGPRDDRYIQIRDGLFPGDPVVVEGNEQLQFATDSPSPPKL